jgi:hypothetical protein
MREYSSLPDDQRRKKCLDDQIGFVALQLGADDHTSVELRWIWRPEQDVLEAFLLARVFALDEDGAVRRAHAVVSRLQAAPKHVFLEALSEQELSGALMPFPLHGGGAVEIRKRVLAAKPQRPDARVDAYWAVQPFSGTTRSWDPVLRAIGKHPHPFVLSVALEPQAVPAEFTRAVAEAASNYRRLASPGEFQKGQIYGGRVTLTPDAFAVEAAEMYADAARRYQGRAFKIRIACYSDHPFDDALPAAIAATISRDDRQDSGSYLASSALGAAYSLVRPDSAQLATFTLNVESLSLDEWHPGRDQTGAHSAPVALAPLTRFVDPEEATTAFRLPVALEGTVPHFPVRSRPPAVLVDYRPSAPSLLLGRQAIGGSDEASELRIALDDLTQHALILGTTGSGKTNSALAFTRQLWADHRIPFMVIEPVNSGRDDYRWLATLPGFEDLLVLTVGDEGTAPLRLNPFQVPEGVRISTHMANLRGCFDAAFGLWDPLPIIYTRALRRTYVEAGFDPETMAGPDERWPVLRDFVRAITAETDTLDYAGEIRSNILAASRLRAESLAEGPCAATLSAPESFPMPSLLERPVVIELAAVGDDPKEQSFIMALLLMTMTEYYKASRESSHLTHVTVIEEAHRLLGKPAPNSGESKEGSAQALAAERFANTLAENRKYGEGILIVEQDPAKLVADAYKNTNLKVMHRLPSEDDRRLIGDTMRFSDDQTAYASALPKMTAFAYHSRFDRPALVAVDDCRALDAAAQGLQLAPLATDQELKARHQSYLAATPEAQRSMAPQADCRICAVTCWLAGPAGNAAQPLIGTFKDQVTQYPKDPGARPLWWAGILEQVDDGTDLVRPARIAKGDRHWRFAVTSQLLKRAYSGDTSRWMEHLEESYPKATPLMTVVGQVGHG